jgi:hypothetical protein
MRELLELMAMAHTANQRQAKESKKTR